MNHFQFVLSLFFALNGFAMSKRVPVDAITMSETGDVTSIVEGCGNQPFVGGTFCRVEEGAKTSAVISLIGPPAKCDRDECVFFKIFDTHGQLIYGQALPKGKTRLDVSWKDIIKRDTFEMADRGTWFIRTTVFWIDIEGHEHESNSTGDIVLKVFRQAYLPLNQVENDQNFVWQWVDNNHIYKMTSSLRAFTKKVESCGLN